MGKTKVELLRSFAIPWNEIEQSMALQIKDIVGRYIQCKASFESVDFWGITFDGDRLTIDEIQLLCKNVCATEKELQEALPYDGEDSVGSIGGDIVNRILKHRLHIEWDFIYAYKDRLILIGCRAM